MTGVLYAKVNGQWVPVEFSGKDEVWVGADDPGIDSSYEIWYDTDDDGPQYGNYAQGVTNLGAFNISNGQAMPTSGSVLFATISNFYYTSGRRYRLFVELNAGIANATAGNCNFTLSVDGTAQAGGVWHVYQPGMHQHFSFEFYMEKYGMSAGLHQITLYFNHGSGGQITLHTDNATVEMRDLGPSNPMNPVTQTTPPAWTAFPFATGWGNYLNTYTPCGYRRLGDMVFLRGLAKCDPAFGGASTSLIGTLPAGYRPPAASIFNPQCAGGALRTDISAGGSINNAAVALTPGNWVSLEGISFSVTGPAA